MRSAQRVYGQVLGLCLEAGIGTVAVHPEHGGFEFLDDSESEAESGGTGGDAKAKAGVSCVGLLPVGSISDDGQLLEEE